jgi:D-amino-acid dehydrogenase
MKKKSDILVIGGGAIGICCAHYLTQSGRQVILIEKGDIGCGASLGNAGLVIPGQSIPLAAPGVITKGLKWMRDPESPIYIKPRLELDFLKWLWKFSRHCTAGHVRRAVPILRDLQSASMELLKELATIEKIDIGLRQEGIVDAYRDRQEFEKGVQTAGLLRQFGLENRILGRDEIHSLLPVIRTNIVGGVFYSQNAHLVPERFVLGLARHAEQNGAVIHAKTEVIGMKKSGRRITSVLTTRGDITANEIVLAGGSWSPIIVRHLELRLFVEPAKGYSISYKRPINFPEIPLLLVEAKVAVTPMDEVLRLAGTLELAGWDLTINLRRVNAILKSVPLYLPDFDPRSLDLIEIWRGLRPCTPDGLPHIGRPNNLDNLIVATGHAMKGISLAPVTGKLVAQLAAGERPDIDLSALNIERFD